MKIQKIFTSLLLAVGVLSLTACGGGGGGNSTQGGSYLTHEQAADEFVTRLNLDLNYDVSLVKSDTKQYGYIVVYDWDYGTYDAYDIDDWVVGENMADFVDWTNKYYDLVDIGGNVYEDWDTGVQFSKTSLALTNNQASLAFHAAKSSKVHNVAKSLNENFGVELSAAMEKAPMLVEFAQNRESLSAGEVDEFSEALVGHSWSKIQEAQKSGKDALQKLFDSSSAQGALLDPDHARQILGL